MPDLALSLANCRGRGYIVAPAGHGKTYTIARAVAQSEGRQLVLTHTYAGVNALRDKFRTLRVGQSAYEITTIASWALKVCLAYPQTSQIPFSYPTTGAQWTSLYSLACGLVRQPFFKRIVEASYSGVIVDEYQDCTGVQHELVDALSRYIPTRVLGDPLQGIFEFDNQSLVDWSEDIYPSFEHLGDLRTPYRWTNVGRDDLGIWLIEQRQLLLDGLALDLERLPDGVSVTQTSSENLLRAQQNACNYFRNVGDETVAAIHAGKLIRKCHSLAKAVGGHFHSIDQVEGADLLKAAKQIDRASDSAVALRSFFQFLSKCISNLNQALPAGARHGRATTIRSNTRNPEVASRVNEYLQTRHPQFLAEMLHNLVDHPQTNVYRRDALNRMRASLWRNSREGGPLLASTEAYHSEFRRFGRPTKHPRTVSTTLLLKGQEFDHAIILDASSLDRKELYVALTRGAKSLKLLTSADTIHPRA